MKLDSNSHSVFKLTYHLVLVVKYRRKVIDDRVAARIREMESMSLQTTTSRSWNTTMTMITYTYFSALILKAPSPSISTPLRVHHPDWLKRSSLRLRNISGKSFSGPAVFA